MIDKGHSTAVEGEVCVDLFCVAADQTFETRRSYVQTVMFDRSAVVTPDVDGMLVTKQTSRESDVSDHLKLKRLSDALRTQAAAAQPKKN